MMEERGLGTKATRADIIQKLYYRGYVHGNPPEPSETGVKMYEGFKTYVPRMADSEMTAQLESEMDQIAQGEMTKDEVLADSRDVLRSAYDEMGDGRRRRGRGRALAQVRAARLERHGRGPDPRPLHRLQGGRPQAGGRLAEHAARHPGTQVGQVASSAAPGWDGDNPDSPDSCDQTFPMPQPRFYDVHKLEEHLLGLRAHAARLGRPEVQAAAAPGSSASTTTAPRWRR